MVKANLTRTQALPASLPDDDDISPVETPPEAPPIQVATATQTNEEALADVEADADLIVKYNPTLTARAFRLIVVMGARSASWAWSRARRDASNKERQPAPDDGPPTAV